jgi:uncharacterized damage-inducible protein DinB
VGELLSHIAHSWKFHEKVIFIDKRTTMEGFDFMAFLGPHLAEQAKPRTKTEIITLLQDEGEKFAKGVEALSDDFLGQIVSLPPGAAQPSRTRFEMLMGVKEHEMHHRGQLMLIERMLGIKPHLTREQETRMAAMQAAAAQKA